MNRPRVNGKRGWFLLIYAVAFAFIGLSYVKFPDTAGRRAAFQWLPTWLPLEWLSAFWWIAAIIAAVSAFMRPPRSDRFGFSAIWLVLVLWSGSFMFSWLGGELDSGWNSACTYGGFALLVLLVSSWPNPLPIAPPPPMEPRGNS